MAVWGLGLVTVVGAALAGSAADGGSVTYQAAMASSVPTGALAPSGALPTLDPARADVVLTSPAGADQVITTRDLVVRGHLREPSWRVQVLLQSRSAEPIVVRTAGPITLPGDQDRGLGRTFVVALPLPDPRPWGPAVLQVVAYDARGRAQDVVLQTIQIGALLDPTFGGAGERSPNGEDGLIGGIPFGTNVVPRGPAPGDDAGLVARCHLPDLIRAQRRVELAGPGC